MQIRVRFKLHKMSRILQNMIRNRRCFPQSLYLRFERRKLKLSAWFYHCRSFRRRWPYRHPTCSAARRSASHNPCIHTRKSAYQPHLKCLDWILSSIGTMVNVHAPRTPCFSIIDAWISQYSEKNEGRQIDESSFRMVFRRTSKNPQSDPDYGMRRIS